MGLQSSVPFEPPEGRSKVRGLFDSDRFPSLILRITALAMAGCTATEGGGPAVDVAQPDVTDASAPAGGQSDTLPGSAGPPDVAIDGGPADATPVETVGSAPDVGFTAQRGTVTVDGQRYIFEMPDTPYGASSHLPTANSVTFGIWRESPDGDYRDGITGTIEFDSEGTPRACDQLAYPSQLRWSNASGVGGADTNSIDAHCTIDIIQRPRCPGDWIVGTFSGQLVQPGNGQKIQITDGEFANRVEFVLHGAPPAPGCR